MTHPSQVMVAVPKDAQVTAAIDFAAAEAVRRQAELLLVHVFQFLPNAPDMDETTLDLRHAENMATEVLRRAHEQAERLVDDRIKVTTRLLRGAVVPELVTASLEARLVVLQRRSLSPLNRVLTRSISSGVAARAHVPVAVVPAGWPGSSHQVVAVGIDSIDRSDTTLNTAIEEARTRGATLRVLHALWSGGYDDFALESAILEARTARARKDLQAALERLQVDGVDVEIDVRQSRAGALLVEASAKSDLVVLGRHDTLVPVGSHLGPVVHTVLRESTCPVLIVAPARPQRG
ncbi:MAG: universal stress protein [Nocardioides sp.]